MEPQGYQVASLGVAGPGGEKSEIRWGLRREMRESQGFEAARLGVLGYELAGLGNAGV